MTWKPLLTGLAWVVVTVLVVIGLLWIFQRSLIYLPARSVPEPPTAVEEVWYHTEDGLRLNAWLVESGEMRGAVIVFNGNAGNRAVRLPLAQALASHGLTVLLTDYRGYGGNPGSPTEEGLALDARAAVTFLEQRYRDLPLVYFGESLGAAVAVGLATENPPDALILRSPFTSLPDVASVHYRWLPASLLLRDRYPNLDLIADVDTPVMVIAGTADTIVPAEQSRAVYEAANEPKLLLTIDGAGHNDRVLLDGDEMMQGVVAFLARRLSG